MSSRDHISDRESGISLIELIIYVLIASILLGATATILVNSWNAQNDVRSTTDATNRGQIVGSAIERAVRNALDLRVLPSDADGTELWVWTSLDGALACQGFHLTDGLASLATSSGPLPPVSGWSEWQNGVLRNDAQPFFARAGGTVVYAFDVETDSAPVRFAGEASMRSTSNGEDSPCW